MRDVEGTLTETLGLLTDLPAELRARGMPEAAAKARVLVDEAHRLYRMVQSPPADTKPTHEAAPWVQRLVSKRGLTLPQFWRNLASGLAKSACQGCVEYERGKGCTQEVYGICRASSKPALRQRRR